MKIESFLDAKRKLNEINGFIDELKEFLDLADNAISAVDMLKGRSKAMTAPLQNGTAPASWSDRLIRIFKDSNRPLMQKDAVEAYAKTGWPRPTDRKDFYNAVSGAIAYLHKKKGLLEKTDEGYRLRE